ncbi:HipA domain-containing protein [Tardiphaga sp. vice278]|uniref:HipA domain-containing protein n=1 Tax=Tardiphaga sp. vice278 TaxID=2592815 RepID=UPI001162312D|nr:HipA domain-containing protein [Tardiphaga sp. vice278]QDM19231.1 hypothetical protein FNL53_27345 [Tardiphaga sp. vice278]
MAQTDFIGVVDVSGWTADEDNPIFPVGSQPKTLLICPDPAPYEGMIPGHRYLFKTAMGWQFGQLWAEVFASRFSTVVDVDVPRAYVGQDGKGTLGALVEFFFGHPGDEAPERFIHASDLLQRSLVDKKRGRPHSIKSNVDLCRALGISDARQWWIKVLIFDVLIGNTDRHPDNWGILAKVDQARVRTFRMAPAFDNGTSLGYEKTEQKILTPWPAAQIDAYVGRGTHHASWVRSQDEPVAHVQLCEIFIKNYPATGQTARNMIRFDLEKVRAITSAMSQVVCDLPFSANRARFVELLLATRQRNLIAALGI